MCIKLAEFRLVPGALESMKTGTVTDSFERVSFAAIAITGIVSGICKGSNQCAIAHKFYEECRSFFYENTLNFLHGELVAVLAIWVIILGFSSGRC